MNEKGYKMRVLLQTILLTLLFGSPLPAVEAVDVHVSIPLPPLIVFPAPPAVVVIPETYVYAVADVDVEIFFFEGWWWRPWEGRWYRSHHYDSGWQHYRRVPAFYKRIPRGWRNDYREQRWKGKEWRHERIPHEQVQQNWRSWEKGRHWEKKDTWGVRDLKPRSRSQQPSSQKVQTKSQPKQSVREADKPRQAKQRDGKPDRGKEHKQEKERN